MAYGVIVLSIYMLFQILVLAIEIIIVMKKNAWSSLVLLFITRYNYCMSLSVNNVFYMTDHVDIEHRGMVS